MGRSPTSARRHSTADYARRSCGRSILGPGFNSRRLHDKAVQHDPAASRNGRRCCIYWQEIVQDRDGGIDAARSRSQPAHRRQGPRVCRQAWERQQEEAVRPQWAFPHSHEGWHRDVAREVPIARAEMKRKEAHRDHTIYLSPTITFELRAWRDRMGTGHDAVQRAYDRGEVSR